MALGFQQPLLPLLKQARPKCFPTPFTRRENKDPLKKGRREGSLVLSFWGGTHLSTPYAPTLSSWPPSPRGGISPSLQEKRKRHQNKRTERTDDGTSLKNFPCKRFKEVGGGLGTRRGVRPWGRAQPPHPPPLPQGNCSLGTQCCYSHEAGGPATPQP